MTAGAGGDGGAGGGTGAHSGGTGGAGGGGGSGPSTPPYMDGGYSIRTYGQVEFQGSTYRVSSAVHERYVNTPKDHPFTETDTHYVVESDFDFPYIPGVTDDLIRYPGQKNLGWATGETNDVEARVIAAGGLPLLYHVLPAHEYGYFVDTRDAMGGAETAFRPAWLWQRQDDGGYELFTIDLDDPDRYGFAWPRFRWPWSFDENLFGFQVDAAGRVYVPKGVALARPTWDAASTCVLINLSSDLVSETRTQFPGDEDYYLGNTFLPGEGSIMTSGHIYWGLKGQPMWEADAWEADSPGGNFRKPMGAGCGPEPYVNPDKLLYGLSINHAEGFTDPTQQAAHAGEISAAQLYRATVYKQAPDGAIRKQVMLSYEPRPDGTFWPTYEDKDTSAEYEGDVIVWDTERNRSGYISYAAPGDGERLVVVIEDL
ncbi:hypothetical protein [Sorangium sp. So ce131]|uniref:hypothetical protein n=1 Tax=Sorangium sp. So ce131 TaxID=3133282 RepID=UPI003F5DE1E1